MKQIEYHELKQRPIDPNKARWYAVGLSAVGAMFAILTIKTNWDYFAQFFDGFAFWARVIPFFAVEALIVLLPWFKGFGNKAQGNLALACEALLVGAALTHTYLVSDASIAKIQAGKTKAEASADFEKTQSVADRITASNQKLQQNYSQQMRHYWDAANIARREGRPVPKAPDAPILQVLPEVSQEVAKNATLSVESAAEARVSHQTLQMLLFAMIGLVTASITGLVLLADGSKIKAWLLGVRAEQIKSQTLGETMPLGVYGGQPEQEPRRVSPVMSPAPVNAKTKPGK